MKLQSRNQNLAYAMPHIAYHTLCLKSKLLDIIIWSTYYNFKVTFQRLFENTHRIQIANQRSYLWSPWSRLSRSISCLISETVESRSDLVLDKSNETWSNRICSWAKSVCKPPTKALLSQLFFATSFLNVFDYCLWFMLWFIVYDSYAMRHTWIFHVQ